MKEKKYPSNYQNENNHYPKNPNKQVYVWIQGKWINKISDSLFDEASKSATEFPFLKICETLKLILVM